METACVFNVVPDNGGIYGPELMDYDDEQVLSGCHEWHCAEYSAVVLLPGLMMQTSPPWSVAPHCLTYGLRIIQTWNGRHWCTSHHLNGGRDNGSFFTEKTPRVEFILVAPETLDRHFHELGGFHLHRAAWNG